MWLVAWALFGKGPLSRVAVGGVLSGPGWAVVLNNASLWLGRTLDPGTQGDLSVPCTAAMTVARIRFHIAILYLAPTWSLPLC